MRELPRTQRFTQEKQQVLVARVVVKGLVEALDLGARTFEDLEKLVSLKRSAPVISATSLLRRDTSRICSICSHAKSGSSLKSDVLA